MRSEKKVTYSVAPGRAIKLQGGRVLNENTVVPSDLFPPDEMAAYIRDGWIRRDEFTVETYVPQAPPPPAQEPEGDRVSGGAVNEEQDPPKVPPVATAEIADPQPVETHGNVKYDHNPAVLLASVADMPEAEALDFLNSAILTLDEQYLNEAERIGPVDDVQTAIDVLSAHWDGEA
jgi:hypothetical protein